MNLIDLSIIIPCYDRINLLKLTLSNIELSIKQLNAEIILIDDGSSETIESQLGEFKHLPIRFVRQENSGLTLSRFNGLMLAQGEFIQFLDSDDQVSLLKFENQICAMRIHCADVSYSDTKNVNSENNELKDVNKTYIYKYSANPAEFYIDIQPAPHSPIFKREYLVRCLKNPYIPLSREYDSIGEVWFYYNLAPYDAKIIKSNGVFAIIINHRDFRLTNYWERLGLCALALMVRFRQNIPSNLPHSKETIYYVGKAAFKTFRGLPYNIYSPFQYTFLKLWKDLGAIAVDDCGKKFMFIAKIIGYKNAAIIFKYMQKRDYNQIKTIAHDELVNKTKQILKYYN